MLDKHGLHCVAWFSMMAVGCFVNSAGEQDSAGETGGSGQAESSDDSTTPDPTGEADGSTAGDSGMATDDGNGVELRHAMVEVEGIQTLTAGFHYEAWAVLDDAPVSLGKFNVDASAVITDLNGIAIVDGLLDGGRDLRDASEFILTIESAGDIDITPAETHFLAGDHVDEAAVLTVGGGSLAFGDDFTAARGAFILATPTDGPDNNESSGLWFLDLSTEPVSPGLELPELPAGWEYEGWAVIDGVPITTGRFLEPTAPDFAAPFSGELDGPSVPGEDFLVNPPMNVEFPAELRGAVAVITIEPEPDDSPAPFGALRPVLRDIPDDAATGQTFTMTNNAASFPTLTLTLVP
ncbi:MAG: hypothetical protein K0V04_37895 [Deltaproteobacteria bacterium]|nr:hypothetical protein [Deltaproteobacteria bacterium]